VLSPVFHRPHHQRISALLNALNAELFRGNRCYFGGGTAIALTYREFRESHDVDFLVSDAPSFQHLRQLVRKNGPSAFFTTPHAVSLHLPFSQDEYGIRGWVGVDEIGIKCEIVAEARTSLDTPGPANRIGNITTLTRSNMITEKLFANSDRYADSSTFHRDLIDLAFMGIGQVHRTQGFTEAQRAYGEAIARDLKHSAARLVDNPAWLTRCLNALAMTAETHSVASRIRHLIGL